MGLLFRKDFGHRARVIAGPRALVSNLVSPGEGLAVEIFQGGEGTGSKEARAHKLDGALDPSFLIPAVGAARSRGEVIVGGEFQEARMEVDGVAATLQNDAAKVVGLQRAGCPTPVVKGVDVTEEKTLERLVEEEFQPQGAAVRKGQDEGGETAVGTPDHHLAEVGPVGLSLLPGESAETEKSFAAQGAEFSHDATKLGEAAGVTAGANHLEEAGGAQARIVLQGLAQEVQEGIGEAIAETRQAVEAIGVQGVAHGLGVQAEFGRNGADLPMLGVEQMTNVSDLFRGNHAAPRKKD